MSIIGFSYFFKYADKIIAPIVITTSSPPVPVVARSTGYLSTLLVNNEDTVNYGDLLVVLQSTARYEDVLKLENQLIRLDSVASHNPANLLGFQPETLLALGDLQPNYSNFIQLLKEYTFKQTTNFATQNINQLQKLKAQTTQLIIIEKDKLLTAGKNWSLAKQRFEEKRKLYSEPNSPITRNELETAKMEENKYEEAYKNIQSVIKQYEGNLLQWDKSVMEIQQNNQEGTAQKYVGLIENINLMKSSIIRWKQQYLLTAPISGKISFFNNTLTEKLNIKEGDQVMAIIPLNNDSIIGNVSINTAIAGKVEIGQKVIIKFDSYPFMQDGVVNGTVKSKALLPKDNRTLSINVTLTNGLKTTYNKQLHFDQQMQGTAEIITKERRLIERIFDKFLK
jgi:multidrug resistance efflux pump